MPEKFELTLEAEQALSELNQSNFPTTIKIFVNEISIKVTVPGTENDRVYISIGRNLSRVILAMKGQIDEYLRR